jgi:hypothetical protein
MLIFKVCRAVPKNSKAEPKVKPNLRNLLKIFASAIFELPRNMSHLVKLLKFLKDNCVNVHCLEIEQRQIPASFRP